MANVPALLEPKSLCRDDGKRSDGLSVLPWANGRCLVWDFTCPDTLAGSHFNRAVLSPSAVANDAEHRKTTNKKDRLVHVTKALFLGRKQRYRAATPHSDAASRTAITAVQQQQMQYDVPDHRKRRMPHHQELQESQPLLVLICIMKPVSDIS